MKRLKKKHWIVLLGAVIVASLLFLEWNRRSQEGSDGPSIGDVTRLILSPDTSLDIKKYVVREQYDRFRESLPDKVRERAEKAEAERLANWKANFPWKPTHDPAIQFNEETAMRYATSIGGSSKGELEALMEEWRQARSKGSPTDRLAGKYHAALKNFFQDEMRFTKQFEDCCRILKEHGREDNPVLVAEIFWNLWYYHHYVNKAVWPFRGIEGREWRNSLVNRLTDRDWLNPHFSSDAGYAEAQGIADRLINEVKGLEDLEEPEMHQGHLTWRSEEVQSLIDGKEQLLVPYAGWYEKSRMWWAEQNRQFEISYERGDPSLKEAVPELFPPVGVRNGRLVDKDGDPVKYREGMRVGIINKRGEMMPMMVDEDGAIRFPTPAEIEEMREEGEVQSAPEEMIQRLPKPPVPESVAEPSTQPESVAPLTPEEQMVLDMIMEQLAE